MRIEIDQSGKIEETAVKTAIGDSHGNVVIFRSKDKKEIQKLYRFAGQPRSFVLQVFSLLVVLLIRKTIKTGVVYSIDREYPGKEEVIKKLMVLFAEGVGVPLASDQIRFSSVGKGSKAHGTSYRAYHARGVQRDVVSLASLVRLLLPQKRTEKM